MPPPPELIARLSLLALRSVRRVMWSNNIADFDCIPWGAGLCVMRPIANVYQDLVARLKTNMPLDRRGEHLFCGGDDLFSWASVGAGQGFGLFPDLRVTHLIPAARLNRQYYLRLVHDHALSHSILNWLLMGKQPLRLGAFGYLHLLLHGIRNGWFSMLCQWAESRGEEHAARFIAHQRLRPIDLDLPLLTSDSVAFRSRTDKSPEAAFITCRTDRYTKTNPYPAYRNEDFLWLRCDLRCFHYKSAGLLKICVRSTLDSR